MTAIKFRSDFGEIAYYKIGEGKKVIVVLHGFLGNPFFLEELFAEFGPKGYAIVGPILPGHGNSFSLPKGYSFVDLCNTMTTFLKSLNTSEISLIGHSMGGALAWQLGKDKSLPIKNIVVVNPGFGKFDKSIKHYAQMYFKGLKVDFPGQINEFKSYKFFKHDGFQWAQIFRFWRMESLVRSIDVGFEVFPEKRKILVLWGKNDFLVSFLTYQEKLERITNVKISLYDGGHHWFIAKKEDFFKELKAFIWN